MANISKPIDINKIWAATGDVLTPSDTKISQGWQVEIPPRQTFNYIDGKQDQAIAHINQHGIAVWDTQTEYQANLSYTQGSDGVIYKALTTNTNINPVGDISGAWQVAFSTPANTAQVATSTQARALSANNVYISPLQLANAFTGNNAGVTGTDGFQQLPGGVKFQWGKIVVGAATGTTWVFPKPLTTVLFNVQLTLIPAAGDSITQVVYVAREGLTSVDIDNTAGTTANTCYIMVIGI